MRSFETNFIVPCLWALQVNKKGSVFVSNITLAETDDAALQLFLDRNFFEIVPVENGAVIRPKKEIFI
jgi:hypothetical protein